MSETDDFIAVSMAYQAEEFKRVGGPAFPAEIAATGGGNYVFTGMTLRDYFAGQALAGICAHDDTWGLSDIGVTVQSYALADEMLKARAHPRPTEPAEQGEA
jgi:hypothetical protein